MHVQRLNAPLFGLGEAHPARRFLEAFIECRRACVGHEFEGIEQRWWSTLDQRELHFSSYVYQRIAFDVVLDGWLTDLPELTCEEQEVLNSLPAEILRVQECQAAARSAGNSVVIALAQQILDMYKLWVSAIEFRLQELQKR